MCGSPGDIIDDAVDFVTDTAKDAADFVKDVVDTTIDFVTDALDIVLSPFGLNFDQPELNQNQQAQIQGVLINKDSAISRVPVVYGTRRVGGSRVFVSTNGTDNKYLYVALIVSEGQVDGYTKFFIDETEVPLSSYAHGVQATPSTGKYQGRLVTQFFDGRDTQVASSLLQEAPGWTSDHRLSGLSYIACRFEWRKIETQEDADNNPYGGIPQIQLVMSGRKIFDATTLTTGVDHTTAYAAETVAVDDNPVSVLLDYLRNPRYGKGLSNDYFDWDSFKSAADQCDQVVNYTSTTTGKAFTCNAVVQTDQTIMNNVKVLLSGFRGIMPYQAGKYFLKIENGGDDTDVAATPTDPTTVFTITEDHIIGGVSLRGESKKDKINRAIVTFVDPDNDYQPNQIVYPEENSADDIAYLADDQVRLEKQFTFTTITNREQALQMAEVMVKKSRNNQTIQVNTTTDPANVSVGDLVRIQNSNIALDGIFRVTGVTLNATTGLTISGTEHVASDYAINQQTAADPRPTINLPDPDQVSAPTNLTVLSGSAFNLLDTNNQTIRRLSVTWTASTDPFLTDYVVQFKKSADADFVTYVQTAETTALISPVALGESYDVRVAARNELNRRSNYTVSTNNTVTDTYTPASGPSSTPGQTGSITNISGSGGFAP